MFWYIDIVFKEETKTTRSQSNVLSLLITDNSIAEDQKRREIAITTKHNFA